MKRWFVLIILGVSQFVMVLDSTVMNVSISTVAADLGTDIGGMQAAITCYALTMAAFMLTGGKLGDKWGRSAAFRIGSIVYGLGSLTTALAPNLEILMLGWSLVEGLGAVLVSPRSRPSRRSTTPAGTGSSRSPRWAPSPASRPPPGRSSAAS